MRVLSALAFMAIGLLCFVDTNAVDCSPYETKKECKKVDGCSWKNNQNLCVSVATDAPTAVNGVVTEAPTTTDSPTAGPTNILTEAPTNIQTEAPSTAPTWGPTEAIQTESPTVGPTEAVQTQSPTVQTQSPTPVPTSAPTWVPTEAIQTDAPTMGPTEAPQTESPTIAVVQTESPTSVPTEINETQSPTSDVGPIDPVETQSPTVGPTEDTQTDSPTSEVGPIETQAPTQAVQTDAPTQTTAPTQTMAPTIIVTDPVNTPSPTSGIQTIAPTSTIIATSGPTGVPTSAQTSSPTAPKGTGDRRVETTRRLPGTLTPDQVDVTRCAFADSVGVYCDWVVIDSKSRVENNSIRRRLLADVGTYTWVVVYAVVDLSTDQLQAVIDAITDEHFNHHLEDAIIQELGLTGSEAAAFTVSGSGTKVVIEKSDPEDESGGNDWVWVLVVIAAFLACGMGAYIYYAYCRGSASVNTETYEIANSEIVSAKEMDLGGEHSPPKRHPSSTMAIEVGEMRTEL